MLLDIALKASTGKVPSSEIEQKTMRISQTTLTRFCLISPLRSLSNSATGYMQGKENSSFFSVAVTY